LFQVFDGEGNDMNEQHVPVQEVHLKTIVAERVDSFFAGIDRIVKIVSKVLLGAMTLTIFLQVFGRFVLPHPFSWTEELARYLMIWVAFIGASSMIRSWENVYVDFFVEKLPLKLKKAVYAGIKMVMLIFMIYVMKITLAVLPPLGMYQTMPALGFPMFWAHLGMMIGLGLVTLQLLGAVLNELLNGGNQ
jgi:TRAP-type C4-dicarboxylate transport system permease small subunit